MQGTIMWSQYACGDSCTLQLISFLPFQILLKLGTQKQTAPKEAILFIPAAIITSTKIMQR
jgi:hypothetical protein